MRDSVSMLSTANESVVDLSIVQNSPKLRTQQVHNECKESDKKKQLKTILKIIFIEFQSSD
jgi:hypothetical protein